MLCPAVLLNIALLLLAEICYCHSHTDTNSVIILVDECLTWIKLSNMCCTKAFQVKMAQISSITNQTNDSPQLISLVILALHPYLFLKMNIFPQPRFFLLLYAASLYDLIFSEREAAWFIFPPFPDFRGGGTVAQSNIGSSSCMGDAAGRKSPVWHPPSESTGALLPITQLSIWYCDYTL